MGLFSSSSKNSLSNEYNTLTETRQTDQSGNNGLNFQDVQGGAAVSFDSNDRTNINETTIYQSLDGGAIETSAKIAAGAYDVLTSGLDGARSLSAGALSSVERISGNSLNLFAELAAGSIESARQLARDSMESSAAASKFAVEGFGALAKQSSESTDDKVSKVAAYGLAAIAAILILPAIFKSGGKAVIA